MNQCTRCNRKLIDKKSIERGYGSVCYKRHLKEQADAEFERNQLTIDEIPEEAQYVS
ncbi:DUF6011 domain-containing protein [Oceanobacillus aidingensis]|uniref:DUF6011 domain-containing protein n=1 Tax=Oceanobacillus aidingensis TaxID=645964 RepID=A0ABV9JVF5_9BACI